MSIYLRLIIYQMSGRVITSAFDAVKVSNLVPEELDLVPVVKSGP